MKKGRLPPGQPFLYRTDWLAECPKILLDKRRLWKIIELNKTLNRGIIYVTCQSCLNLDHIADDCLCSFGGYELGGRHR